MMSALDEYEESFDTMWVRPANADRITTRAAAFDDARLEDHLDWLRKQTGPEPKRHWRVHHRDASQLDRMEHLARTSEVIARLESQRAIEIHRLTLDGLGVRHIAEAVALPWAREEVLHVWARWSQRQREQWERADPNRYQPVNYDPDEHAWVGERLRGWVYGQHEQQEAGG